MNHTIESYKETVLPIKTISAGYTDLRWAYTTPHPNFFFIKGKVALLLYKRLRDNLIFKLARQGIEPNPAVHETIVQPLHLLALFILTT